MKSISTELASYEADYMLQAGSSVPAGARYSNVGLAWRSRMAHPLERQVVERARKLIANRRNWTRNVGSRFGNGRLCVDITDRRARKFCGFAALVRAALDIVPNVNKAADIATAAARKVTGDEADLTPLGKLAIVNDVEGHAAVLRLFDEYLAVR